jgi:SAM-dependent methyltransferase
MYCIDSLFPGWQGSKIHESSPGKRGASMRLKAECRGYLPTQYYPGVTPGTVHDGFRCENLEALTFKDESIDLHVTQDVFEHVLAPEKAFGEIARTLKPGGAHVFTTPLVNKDRPSLPRARRGKGDAIEHLVPKPEYHGNPISAEGSLVTMHWGYDICDHIYRASGLFTTIVLIDAVELGIRADLIEVLITRKPWTVRAD